MSVLQDLAVANDNKIVLLVMDGLGGIANPDTGLTELETARTPNLDKLAPISSCGQHYPIRPGITAGSGPAHLGLFGYDPLEHNIGRGVLSALGLGLELDAKDVACRINFATMRDGKIIDRRAGRIPTDECVRLCKKLEQIRIPEVEITIAPEMQHRAAIVFRGEGLSGHLADSDPQKEGLAPLPIKALSKDAERTARIANDFLARAEEVLSDEPVANMILMRGFDKSPAIDLVPDLYKIRAAAIAVYPMYRGLAKLVGMDVLKTGKDITSEFTTLEEHWDEYDFFFVHVKPTDSAGEDGNYARKIAAIEETDALIPRALALRPAVLTVTGDHSTPAALKAHSWHPVPVLLHSDTARRDSWLTGFSESQCARGSLGTFLAKDLMALMLAHAQKLQKFGA